MNINNFADERDADITDMLDTPVFVSSKMHGFGTEKVCYYCKKSFHVSSLDLYAYKLHRSKKSDVWFCKWSCMCAYRREHHDKRKKSSHVRRTGTNR